MSNKLRKIIYIMGLGHSGSTVLDLLLTTTRKAVGLGQVWNVLTEDAAQTRRRQCSCGASALDCEFWSPILPRVKAGDRPYAERYRIVLDNVDRLYGADTPVIDSSKLVSHLEISGAGDPKRKIDRCPQHKRCAAVHDLHVG